MQFIHKLMLCIVALAALSVVSATSFAHEGHEDTSALTGGGAAVAGEPLTLSPESIANLGVKTVAAEMKPLPDTLSMPATVALLPEKQAQMTTRFDGRIQEIKVKIGEDVQKGQDLIIVEPVQIGTNVITYKAPMTGRVMQQNVVLGQAVTFQTSLIDIADIRQVLMKGAVYETPDLARLKVGQKVIASIGIYPGKVFEGVIEKIDAGPSADSRALHIYALFDNAAKELKPNLRGTMTVTLDSEDTQPTVVVPLSSVLENNGVSFVFVKEKDKFERREVQLGRKSRMEAEIVSGVLPAEEVVTQGNYQLQYLKPTPHNDGGH
ncbi:MAG: efflux RND transporter periplasmic adaptor subunit [bacterium]|nr:efflux RND transporter periplasmic adaptor subunit [bacterium]